MLSTNTRSASEPPVVDTSMPATPDVAAFPERLSTCHDVPAGTVALSSSLPSIRSFYEAGDWGSLADPTDPRDHAAAIGHLLDHADEASCKGRRGRSLVEEQFNWSAEAHRLLAFYARVW